MKYKIRVDKDAVEGENGLNIRYTNDRYSGSWVIPNFPIQISDVQTDFDLVIQESSGTAVSIAIANIGKNVANSLIVRVLEQSGYSISGTNGQMVGNLDAGDYTIVSFNLAQIGRGSGLQVQLDYTDVIGVRRSVIKEIQLFGESQIKINSTEFDSIPSGNFPRGNFQESQNKSIFRSVWFGVLFVLLGMLFFYYCKKNPRTIKKFLSKISKKFERDKSSKEAPEWVLTERTIKK